MFETSRPQQVGIVRFRNLVAFAGVALAILFLPAVASAAPEFLWQAPEDGLAGAGAGRLDHANGIAADPTSGHVYVTDNGNNRVVEYDAWGRFVKAWGWGVATGAAQLETCGPGATPPTATCQEGIAGNGAGQFQKTDGGVSVDAAGNIYAGDFANGRIQKFDSSGKFLLMFGDEVDTGPNHAGDVCTAAYIAEGENCGAGTPGKSLPSQFEHVEGDTIELGPGGTVYVGGSGRVQEFNSDGTYKGEIKSTILTCGGNPPCKRVEALDVDSAGNLYVDLNYKDVKKLSSSGELLLSYTTGGNTTGVAVDDSGNLYASITLDGFITYEIVEFGPAGEALIPPGSGFAKSVRTGDDVGTTIGSLALNTVTASGGADVYLVGGSVHLLDHASAYGPGPDKWPAPQLPPEINAQYAISVDSRRASVGAEINPLFWADTSYYVEWGTGKCSEGGCLNHQPAAASQLGAGVVNRTVPTRGVVLPGLEPNTTYHYRFVAQSGGGGPTVGVGPEEAETTFHTLPLPPPLNESCANQGFRSGASARLPDCRAYEMVSPIDKNNTDIASLINLNSNPAALNQSAAAGQRLTYTTAQGFGDAKGVAYVSQYIANRTASGWQNHGITPPQGLTEVAISGRVDVEFRAFTSDLCESALLHMTDPPLAAGAPEGFANLYSRDNCQPDADTYKALTTTTPPTRAAFGYVPRIQGLSANGKCTVFSVQDQLTPDANPGTPPKSPIEAGGSNFQLYESCGGKLSLVSTLPNGKATTADAATGSIDVFDPRSGASAQAVSADGSIVYWTNATNGPGALYARINANEGQSEVVDGQCVEDEKACTIPVSGTVTPGRAHYWGASRDGSRVIFTLVEGAKSGNVYEFNLEEGASRLIATGFDGMLGVGSQGETMRSYFLSTNVLSGANGEGVAPAAGQPNLYFYEGSEGMSSIAFVATLSKVDAHPKDGDLLGPAGVMLSQKTSRVSPDGRRIAFMSIAPLTGYDNVDQANGVPDGEVFTYDPDTETLACTSCNPTGQRPAGRRVTVEAFPSNQVAALLPTYATGLYGSRVVTDDGKRVFFNSYEALIRGDTNGKADVYQWEAPGSGDCSEQAPAYSPPNNGCLSLISSGESPTDSEFMDASADGTDVFFTTASSLLPQDPGLIDIYDARAGGGYPPPPARTAECEGEACQGPLSPPNDPTPASSSFEGAGNVKSEPKRKETAKRKHAKRHRKAPKKQKRANHERRAGR